MKISIITLFPEMISGFFAESIVKRAESKGVVAVSLLNPRAHALDSYGTVDNKPYGGGTGMVLRIEPIYETLKDIDATEKKEGRKIIITSPKGVKFDQEKAIEYSKLEELIIIAGHYEAIDERIMSFVDEEVSLGDFVMTGGEITASAITDAVVRLIPGALSKTDATEIESFFEVPLTDLIKAVGVNDTLTKLKDQGVTKVQLLEFPHYTRPEEFMGMGVPEVLLSGNHEKIATYRLVQAFEETCKKRPDLLEKNSIK